jgi:alpha-L-rhamnosidase
MIALPAVIRVLAAAGRDDLLYDAVTRTTYPGYGHWLSKGATSIPESWDWSGTEGVPDLNILGDIDAWFTSSLAGIQAAPGTSAFQEIIIAPAVVGTLDEVEGRLRTVRGEITSHWVRHARRGASSEVDEEELTLTVTIPANTIATVVLPLHHPAAAVTAPEASSFLDRDHISARYRVGSGSWTFTAR